MSVITTETFHCRTLAETPVVFPATADKPALVACRVLTSRRWQDRNGQWQEADRPVATKIIFRGRRAETLITNHVTQLFPKGSPVIAIGQIDDQPDAYLSNNQARATNVLVGHRISLDTLAIERRIHAKVTPTPSPAGTDRNPYGASDGFAPTQPVGQPGGLDPLFDPAPQEPTF